MTADVPAGDRSASARASRWYEGYIFDLDGTVYLGQALLPTAAETIARLRELGRRTVFLSNNPSYTRQGYAEKLTRLGVPTPVEDIINSSTVMVDFLLRNMPQARLFIIGEQPLMSDLRQAGFELVEEAGRTDAVIVSFDRTFDYRKLQVAFDAIRAGARFFATNPDRYCPVPGGGQPDAGALITAVETCTSRRVEAVVGKPSPHMAKAILNVLKMPPEQCIMIGDRLETDVQMGVQTGMDTALTLTGATDRATADASCIRPTCIIERLADLIPPEHAMQS